MHSMKVKAWLPTGLLTLVLSGCSSGPNSVVDSFYRAAEKGEVSRMVELINMESPQAQMMGSKLKIGMEAASKEISSAGIKDLDIKCEEKAEYATCMVNITLKNGSKKSDKLDLSKKKEGKWLINLGM